MSLPPGSELIGSPLRILSLMADRDDKAAECQLGFSSLPRILEVWDLLQLHKSAVSKNLTLQNPNLRERVQVKIREEIYGGGPGRDQL